MLSLAVFDLFHDFKFASWWARIRQKCHKGHFFNSPILHLAKQIGLLIELSIYGQQNDHHYEQQNKRGLWNFDNFFLPGIYALMNCGDVLDFIIGYSALYLPQDGKYYGKAYYYNERGS